MRPPLSDSLRRLRGWLIPAALLALTPKCVLCLLAYAGMGGALGLSGPELCGAPPGQAGHGLWLLPVLGVALGLAAWGRRRVTPDWPGLKPKSALSERAAARSAVAGNGARTLGQDRLGDFRLCHPHQVFCRCLGENETLVPAELVHDFRRGTPNARSVGILLFYESDHVSQRPELLGGRPVFRPGR